MGSNLYNQMMRLSKEERIKMLKSDNVREIFLKDNNHYPFVWLIGGLEDDELYNFIDSLYLKQIFLRETAWFITWIVWCVRPDRLLRTVGNVFL